MVEKKVERAMNTELGRHDAKLIGGYVAAPSATQANK